MSSKAWLENAFRKARTDFLSSIPQRYHEDFSKFGTVGHVYQEISDIQKRQMKTRTLVALKRIEPYIIGLKEYAGVIEVFTQVHPEILCLIWGPLKLILQLASSVSTAFNKLVAVIEEIGYILPQFKRYSESGIFDANEHAKTTMCLFYRDILDLHLEMFKFFQKKAFHVLLESLWPQFRGKLAVIQGNIDRHKMLVTSNVTLEHVLQAEDFRRRAHTRFGEAKKREDEILFKSLSDMLSSPWCRSKLQSSVETSSASSGDWIFTHPSFQRWLNGMSSVERCIWVQGIPGAGKTILAANAIHRLQNDGQVVLYAFLSHERQSFGAPIPVFKSILFQIAEAHRDLAIDIHSAFTTGSNGLRTTQSVKDLFCRFANSCGPLIIAVDGLDEIDHQKCAELLSTLLDILNACSNTRLLVSSREERSIMRLLENKTRSLRVNENNANEIEEYVRTQGDDWVTELRQLGATDEDCASIKDGLKSVVTKATGMFLYAKLVLGTAKAQFDLESVQAELANLPNGLDQVYSRILSRLKENEAGQRVLLWVACAKRPVQQAQILQALLIKQSMQDFSMRQRKAWLDILAACGPVIEIRGGIVEFVHFTAREYLFGSQSENFLKLYDGQLECATVLLTYLSLRSFDRLFAPSFSEEDKEDLHRHIISGDFILFEYAANFWLEHIKYLSQLPLTEAVKWKSATNAVTRFLETRKRTPGIDENPSKARAFLSEFDHFEGVPDVQKSLAESERFFERLQNSFLVPEGDDWVLEDPTMLSSAALRFRVALENMLTDCKETTHSKSCSCSNLWELYGTNVFKCRRTFCYFHRHGFTKAENRDSHEKTHQSANRCPESGCPFATLGFQDERELTIHILKTHPDRQHTIRAPNSATPANFRQLDTSQRTRMLEHSIINGDIGLCQDLVATATELEEDVDFDMLLQLAVWRAPDSMIEFLVSKARDFYTKDSETDEQTVSDLLENALLLAAVLDKLEAARCLLRNGANPNGDGGVIHVDVRRRFLSPRGIKTIYSKNRLKAINAACRNMSSTMIELLVDEFTCTLTAWCFAQSIRANKRNPSNFIELFPGIKRFMQPDFYSYGISTSVLNDNISALEVCLENGGNPNITDPIHNRNKSALYMAVEYWNNRDDSEDFITKLLEAGADPFPTSNSRSTRSRKIQELSSMKTVENHFGMKWEDLVKKIQGGDDVSSPKASSTATQASSG
ncbi:hypothetical protein BKA56DRAFT_677385 [Ilyonectria sp. MPI-CAGE-AT-0026]|nr:hypothetical protein BKA56DRAFT_677385 [Ilyonectria sp. MPI-CAGE-AT-0026]